MKKIYTREIVAYVAILFLIFIIYDHRRKSNLIESQLRGAVISRQSQIKYLTNELGKIVSEKESAELSYKQFIEMYRRESDELKRSLNIKPKNLKAYLKADIQASGSGESTVKKEPIDSLDISFESEGPNVLSFRDGYLSFDVDLNSNKSSYQYTDTLIYAVSSKKKWFLGKDHLYSSGMMSNKNAKIYGSTDVLINNYKDKRWSVNIGIYYDPFRAQPGVAIGVGYSLIKF